MMISWHILHILGPRFAKTNHSSGTEVHLNIDSLTRSPFIYTMDHIKTIVTNQMENIHQYTVLIF